MFVNVDECDLVCLLMIMFAGCAYVLVSVLVCVSMYACVHVCMSLCPWSSSLEVNEYIHLSTCCSHSQALGHQA